MDHTLLIRIKDRPSWILAMLETYKELSYKGTIILADDSDDKHYHELSKELKNHNQFTFKVIHKKYYQYPKNSIRSQREGNTGKYALHDIKTKYFTYGTDDDLSCVDFFRVGINFLESNTAYSAVTGSELIRDVILEDGRIKDNFFLKYWRGYEDSDPLDRISRYCVSPSLLLFGVIRTESAIKSIQIADSAVSNHKFIYNEELRGIKAFDSEIPYAVMALAYGKVKSIPSAMMSIRHKWLSRTRTETAWQFKKNSIDSDLQGQIVEIINPSFHTSLLIFLTQISILVAKFGTKYDQYTIHDVLYKSFWLSLKKFNGRPLRESQFDYSEELQLISRVEGLSIMRLIARLNILTGQILLVFFSLKSKNLFNSVINDKKNRFIANIYYFKMVYLAKKYLINFDEKLIKLLQQKE